MIYVVDRIEGERAIVIADDGRTLDIERHQLPAGCSEGAVLRAGETPDWTSAVVDEPERQRRMDRARATLQDLSAKDGGGDIDL
ncbi:MAG TPA: DUF3006 domain-containing protein [Myxococcales bacterium]